ncbi:MAG: response regulator [Lachnospiraceae bacterium]|nr:response regulator [Lachnospiraceae bacterium]
MRIIVVDNEDYQLETMAEYLKDAFPSAKVWTFQKPIQALESLKENGGADLALLETSLEGNMNGIELAIQCRRVCPKIRILFCTSHREYALDAFKIHANGYLCKPVTEEDLKSEIEYLFGKNQKQGEEQENPQGTKKKQKPYIRTFGNFEVFADGKPVVIRRSKSKEILALLTNQKGVWMTNKELSTKLWDSYILEVDSSKYISTLIKELIMDLEEAGIPQIIERRWGRVRLCVEEVECDYYDYLSGTVSMRNSYAGEYMAQYSWGKLDWEKRTESMAV